MSKVFPKYEELVKNLLKNQGFSDIIHFVRKESDLPICGKQQGEENTLPGVQAGEALRTNFNKKGRNQT